MFIVAYPNPAFNILTIFTEGTVDVTMILVDNQFNEILTSNHQAGSYQTSVDVSSINTSNNLIRFYYIATRNDTCFYKGHGDIKIN